MKSPASLLLRIRTCVWIMIIGLVISGATAIPLQWQVDTVVNFMGLSASPGADTHSASPTAWLLRIQEGIHHNNTHYPFMAYGTDWLAFGHFVIAIAFIGTLRNPVRNIWLFEFGLIACALIIPYAMIFGGLRGIPWWWRLADCSFGLLGAIPLWLGRKYTRQLELTGETIKCTTPVFTSPRPSPQGEGIHAGGTDMSGCVAPLRRVEKGSGIQCANHWFGEFSP